MASEIDYRPSVRAKWGWSILIVMSSLLILAGIGWFLSLPEMAIENIAEYAHMDPGLLRQSAAFDIISMIARGYGAAYTAIGLMGLLVALEGYRRGTRWTWSVMWVPAASFAALAATFMQAGESPSLSLGILSFALITVFGLLIARRGQPG